MRVGAIADVHANLVALEAVLEDVPPVDALVCAGDVVGYNPWPAECVDAMRGRPAGTGLDAASGLLADGVPTVEGNHDRMVAGATNFRANDMAQAGVEYAKGELSTEQVGWLRDLPRTRTLFDGRLTVVHDHPDRRDHYTYPEEFSPDLLGDEDVLVLGHTHVQHHEVYDEGIVLNPGSVGQPRDRDPRAAYAVVDLEDLVVEEHRVEYDVPAVQRAVEEAGLPARIGSRLAQGR